jgi:hypothetical protein
MLISPVSSETANQFSLDVGHQTTAKVDDWFYAMKQVVFISTEHF